jgi:predicted ArsR family transcriptional regulator
VERREEILQFLKARGRASLADVAAHLGLSKQGALRHLEQLESHGLVEFTTEERTGPGRPGHVYRLTAAAGEHFPSSHRELVAELVQFVGRDQLDAFFALRAARLEAEYRPQLEGLELEEKVRRLARLASEHGHMATVEDDGGTLSIRQCNCPIADVAVATGMPCRHEAEMYSRLLDAEVTRATWMAEAAPACTYTIRPAIGGH